MTGTPEVSKVKETLVLWLKETGREKASGGLVRLVANLSWSILERSVTIQRSRTTVMFQYVEFS